MSEALDDGHGGIVRVPDPKDDFRTAIVLEAKTAEILVQLSVVAPQGLYRDRRQLSGDRSLMPPIRDRTRRCRASRGVEAQNTDEAFWPTFCQGASRVSGLGQELYRRRAGGSSRVRRTLNEPRRHGFDADARRPQGSEIGERWHFDGARSDDENDDVVEIAVIPIAADPRRVGRIGVGCGHQREQGSDEEDYAVPLQHTI